MIHITESLRLAATKFKTRKFRNLFSSFTVSLGITVILSILIAMSGVLAIAGSIFKDYLAGKAYAFVDATNCTDTTMLKGGEVINEAPTVVDCNSISIPQKLKDVQSTYGIKSFTEQKLGQNIFFRFKGNEPVKDVAGNSDTFNISAVDEILIKDYINKDYNWDQEIDGAIPVIIPDTYFYKQALGQEQTKQEQYEKRKEVLDKYLGKEFFLEFASPDSAQNFTDYSQVKYNYSDTKVKVKIVGFTNIYGSFFGSTSIPQLSYSFIISNKLYEKSPLKQKIDERLGKGFYLVEFDSVENRNKFIKDGANQKLPNMYSNPVMSRYEMVKDFVNVIRTVGLSFGGFLLLISSLFLLTTVGKIADDSRREIGVFRAFGAKKGDIKKILYGFTLLLTSTGFLLGLVFAMLLCLLASILWGQQMFYSMAILATTIDVQKPLFVFLGFPGVEIILLLLFISVLGIIAAYFPVRKASNIDVIRALRSE